MTNQPKDNEWIEKIASYMHDVRANRFIHQKYNCSDENMDRREKQARTKYSKLSEEDKEKDRKFAREILANLPKPTEVLAPVDIEDIIEKIGYIKRYSDTRYFDWEEVKKELRKILSKGTTPVEPINQERLREIKKKYQLRLERNRKERDKTSIEGVSEILTKEFVEDLQSLHQSLPQSEQERVVEIEKYKGKCECGRYIRYGMDYKYCYGCGAKIKRVS